MNSLGSIDKSSGFTLIELMAALLISSILMIAMYQNFIIANRSYQLLEGYALLQENARFSSDVMARTIRMAGYRKDPGMAMGDVFNTASGGGLLHALAAGQLVSGENNNVGADVILNGSDSITIRYQGNGSNKNCVGGPVNDNYGSVNTFYVDTGHNLQCKPMELYETGVVVNSAAASRPLIEGVENMQILYGIDNSGNLIADNYLNAGAMAASDWLNVVSVRIAVLYNTVNLLPQKSSQSFTMLDDGVSTFNDGLRRQLFTTTINLRNKSQ